MSYIAYTSIIEMNKRAVSDISSFQNLQSSGHFSTGEIHSYPEDRHLPTFRTLSARLLDTL